MSFFSPVNQARALSPQPSRLLVAVAVLILFFAAGAELLANDRPLLVQYRGQLYVPVLKLHRANLRRRVRHRRRLSGSGCSSSWRLTAGRYGRQYASARRHHLPARFLSIAALSQQLARHRRQRRRCAGADPGTRISVLFGLLLTLFSSVLGCWPERYRVTTAVKSTCGAALYRSLVRHANAVPDHPALQRRAAGSGGCWQSPFSLAG